jgi:hemerythrin-like domain-containing protein
MANSRAIRALMHEHEIILTAVSGIGRMAETLRGGGHVEIAALREAVDFMRNFADKCHHAKEEDLLFPALTRAGMPENGGPIAVMKAEHAQARICVGNLASAIDAYEGGESVGSTRVAAAIDCIETLYPQHVAKENNVLFPMAEQILSSAILGALAKQFEATERMLGEEEHHRWAAVAEQLASGLPAMADIG